MAYGTQPATYTSRIDVGAATQVDMPVLPDGVYYVAVQAYTSTGFTSGFSNEISISIAPPSIAATPEQKRADFDTDGYSDILWQNTATGALAAWAMQGTSLKLEGALTPGAVADVNWRVAGTGDFNNDGRPDIVFHHKSAGWVAVWFMRGLTSFGGASFSIPQIADVAWKIAGIGDFNRDGQADVLWQHDTGAMKLWTMNGTTVISEAPLYQGQTGDPRWRAAGVFDVNTDGHVDILWRHADTGWLAAWLLNGVVMTEGILLDPNVESDPAWRIAGYIDANQDGKQDILWQHATLGTVKVWLMDGPKRLQTISINQGSLGGPNWKVAGPK